MVAQVLGSGSDQTVGAEKGQHFKCPECGHVVLIRDNGALFIGGVISAFWLAVGYWAFLKGPYWYGRNFSILTDGDRDTSFLWIDLFVILLSLGTIALSLWVLWTFTLSPLRDRWRNPVVGETRPMTTREIAKSRLTRRDALLAFFIFPLGIWMPLLGLIWGLDQLGFEMSENSMVRNSLVFGVLGLVYFMARRIGQRAFYTFFGMVFWLAIAIGLIFALG